jgi:hypothetical protein
VLKNKLLVILALSPIAIHSCVILPIPTPAHSGYGVVTDETLQSLKPGQATRADVILRLGDPSRRIDEDRFFIYQWRRTYGYLFMAIVIPAPYTAAGAGDITNWEKAHFLVMEFTTDSRLKRSEFINPTQFGDPPKQVDELIAEWRQESSVSD